MLTQNRSSIGPRPVHTPAALPDHWIGVAKEWNRDILDLPRHLVSLPPNALKTHALLIGSTGVGKTTLIHHLMAQDILAGNSFINLDLRGNLVKDALVLCATAGVDPKLVRVIDLREKTRPFGFNPLAGNGEFYFRALQVLQVIANESESFGVQLSETLRYALLLLTEAGESLPELERVFYDAQFRRACLAKVTSIPVADFWGRFDELPQTQQRVLAMPVMNKVSLLLSTSTLRRILGHPKPIDLAKHLNTKGSVLLASLAIDELHGAATMMGTMLLSSICREIFARVNIPEHSRNRVRLYVDEFEHFGMQDFEAILAEGRKFGLSVVLAHQTLAQLAPKMRSLILNNVGVKAVFRTGWEDSGMLSRDLTGDSKALAFAEMPVGEAMVWQKGSAPKLVEINEPIVSNSGAESPEVRQYVDAVYAQSEVWQEPLPAAAKSAGCPTPEPEANGRPSHPPTPADPPSEGKSRTRPRRQSSAPMEDWLCD
ncbi:MAG: type IV secretory system conjugative DNA transfer family protein [Fimbriimonadaceae bacterium]